MAIMMLGNLEHAPDVAELLAPLLARFAQI
jgi:hypothetical protein